MPGASTERDDRGLRGGWARFQQHRYRAPSPDVARYVDRYWAVDWDLRGEPPYRQRIVPYPNVHLTFLGGVGLVRGVARRYVTRELAGQGNVFGVAFRPGAFRPFLGRPVSEITDRTLRAVEVFGTAVPEREVTETADPGRRAALVEEFLRARLPEPDPSAELAARIVEQVANDPSITRVDALAARAGLGVRRLQRLFAEYVGVGPKWVIRRYRLDEATRRMAAGAPFDWALLAFDLGYADQAHFTRDFTAMVGEPPSRYAMRYPTRDT